MGRYLHRLLTLPAAHNSPSSGGSCMRPGVQAPTNWQTRNSGLGCAARGRPGAPRERGDIEGCPHSIPAAGHLGGGMGCACNSLHPKGPNGRLALIVDYVHALGGQPRRGPEPTNMKPVGCADTCAALSQKGDCQTGWTRCSQDSGCQFHTEHCP